MDKKETIQNPITEGVIWKQLMLFFFPIALGTFFQQIYNTTDAVIVGRYVGKEALASVGGSTNQIILLIVGFFIGLSSGATVIISQFYGAKDRENVHHALHTALAFSLAGSAVITVLGVGFSPLLLRLMNTPADLMKDSILYLQIFFAGIVFVFLYNVGSGILRAVGDSKRPLYYLIVCCFINVGLDLLFIIRLHMGVLGVALATVIAQAISSLLVLYALCHSHDMLKLRIRDIRFHRSSLHSLLRIGLPSGFQSIMYNISNVIIQTCLNSFGTDTVAAWTAFLKIDATYWLVSNAIGISITTFVGQNFGARKFDRVRKSIRTSFCMAMTSAILLASLLIFGGSHIYRLFTNDPTVLGICMQMTHIIAPAYVLYVFIEILSGTLRGAGNVLVPTFLTCGGICGLRLLWVIFAFPLRREISMVLYCYPISWGITAILYLIYYNYYKKKWPV